MRILKRAVGCCETVGRIILNTFRELRTEQSSALSRLRRDCPLQQEGICLLGSGYIICTRKGHLCEKVIK